MAEPRQRRPRRRRRSGFIEIVNGALSLLVLAILIVAGLLVYGAHSFYADTTVKKDTDFLVRKGSGMSDIAGDLEDQHLISNRWVFQLGGVALHKQRQIKTGEFKIAAGSSMADIWHELTEGKPVEFGITIPEGFTSWQVVSRLNEDNQLTGEITVLPPEGSVLPQTYNYEPGMTRQSVLDRMEAAMKAKLSDIWTNRDPSLPFSSPQQLVTLASIVEKETGVPGERSHVAAVFINRLQKHMRLQSDPTTIYGITKGQSTLGRPLKKAEIEANTAYNTYQIDGLPPTPIANPGTDALMAAAHPTNTKDIYFVAAGLDPSDGHLFAASYADHRKNVAKLRKLEEQQAEAPPEDAIAAEDQLEQQQAKQAGDTTADGDGATPPAATGKSK